MIKLVKVNKYFNRRKRNQMHIINNTSLELGDNGLVAFREFRKWKNNIIKCNRWT